LIRLVKDHENISEFLEGAEQTMGFLHDEEEWKKIKPIEEFFQRYIIYHLK